MHHTDDGEAWVTVREAAAMFGVSRSTIQSWIRKRQIKPRVPGMRGGRYGGRHAWYDVDELAACATPRRSS